MEPVAHFGLRQYAARFIIVTWTDGEKLTKGLDSEKDAKHRNTTSSFNSWSVEYVNPKPVIVFSFVLFGRVKRQWLLTTFSVRYENIQYTVSINIRTSCIAMADLNNDDHLYIICGNWEGNHRIFLQLKAKSVRHFRNVASAFFEHPSPIRTV
jgi:hypothetical protein